VILETLVTTVDREGGAHCAPMGIRLDARQIVLRPFRTAATCANLEATGAGVVNFTDDVLLFARCALTPYLPPVRKASQVPAPILEAACSWREFRVTESDPGGERALFRAEVVAAGRGREFLGFNRAQHAVIEATILATRRHLLDRTAILADIERLRPLVEKTAGGREQEAFALVRRVIEAGDSLPGEGEGL
jgi:hypothetical protein